MTALPLRIIRIIFIEIMYTSFEQFLVVSRGLQPITIFGYVETVKRMVKVLGENPTHTELIQYMQTFYMSEYSYSYKINTALALERYSEYRQNPIRFGRQKKPRSLIKETLTEGEITKVLMATKNVREEAIISLLAYSGLRNSELGRLRVNSVDYGSGTIRVIRGKGLKDALCNIPSVCVKTLLSYLSQYPREQDDFLFETLRKKNRYHNRDLRKLVHVVAKRAGLKKRIYPYLFRHSLAVNILNRGADVFLVKTQLRHSLIETTMHYLNSLNYEGKSTYDKYAPSYN